MPRRAVPRQQPWRDTIQERTQECMTAACVAHCAASSLFWLTRAPHLMKHCVNSCSNSPAECRMVPRMRANACVCGYPRPPCCAPVMSHAGAQQLRPDAGPPLGVTPSLTLETLVRGARQILYAPTSRLPLPCPRTQTPRGPLPSAGLATGSISAEPGLAPLDACTASPGAGPAATNFVRKRVRKLRLGRRAEQPGTKSETRKKADKSRKLRRARLPFRKNELSKQRSGFRTTTTVVCVFCPKGFLVHMRFAGLFINLC